VSVEEDGIRLLRRIRDVSTTDWDVIRAFVNSLKPGDVLQFTERAQENLDLTSTTDEVVSTDNVLILTKNHSWVNATWFQRHLVPTLEEDF
jgi:hypothetical protein